MTDPTAGDASADDSADAAADGELTVDDILSAGSSAGASAGAEPADGLPVDMAGYASAEEALTDAVGMLEKVTLERDEYLDLARRVQAEFENYKRRIEGQKIEQVQRAAEALVVEILPVLDACEAALGHGAEDVGPIHSALLNTLEKRGLAKVDDTEVSFDPLVHEAVLTEAGDGADGEPLVTEILRTGYAWNGRVVRPAMVKVRG